MTSSIGWVCGGEYVARRRLQIKRGKLLSVCCCVKAEAIGNREASMSERSQIRALWAESLGVTNGA